MGIDLLGQVAVLSGLAIGLSSLPGAAIDLNERSNLKPFQIAQAGETNCRQTNTVAGVYQQPDPISVSQGVLPAGQTVRLEVIGTGTGWSRIREPIVGWVEARYLTPPTPCAYPVSAQPERSVPARVTQASVNPTSFPQVNPAQPAATRSPVNSVTPPNFPQPNLPPGRSQVTVPPLSAAPQSFPQPQAFPQPTPQPNNQSNNIAVRPTVPPLPAIASPQSVPTGRAIVTTTCDVLPREGLVVRRQPDLNSTGVSIIPVGTYNFQFTGATQTIGSQRLAYIVAPAEGWIQVLAGNGGSTLGGGRCG